MYDPLQIVGVEWSAFTSAAEAPTMQVEPSPLVEFFGGLTIAYVIFVLVQAIALTWLHSKPSK